MTGQAVAVTATVAVVTPQIRGIPKPEDVDRIMTALAAQKDADVAVRKAVLAAVKHGASVRELAAATGLSTNTITRWKRGE